MNTLLLILAPIVILGLRDVFQRKHAILRNFPIIGHFRYLLESLGPEFRQYIISSDKAERPFNRNQRRWIYSSSKKENDYFGFGTESEVETTPNYLIIKHSAFPLPEAHPGEPAYDPTYQIPCAKILGEKRNRKKAFRPASVVNVSAMSYGALSYNAVEALNRGAKMANSLHNTGEGGIAFAHGHGGDLIWQIGTGYFGCRDAHGKFSIERFVDKVSRYPVKAIEIKLSQGAKPGLGGVLPGRKVTEEISRIRGVEPHRDCISPSQHTAFKDADSLLDFVELLAEKSGLPVGIKSAVGETSFWKDLSCLMVKKDRGVDFITIDGGEGGTGAGPLVFGDHVSLPFKMGMARVYAEFAEKGIAEDLVFIGSGKLGFPEASLFAFALGCDMVNIAREAMLSIGCIQAQRCHTNQCPTGVATQSKWLMRGLDPTLKSARLANYITVLRKELLRLSRACGVIHPSLVSSDHLEIINDRFGGQRVTEVFHYHSGWGVPSEDDVKLITSIMKNPQGVLKPAEAPTIKDTPLAEHPPQSLNPNHPSKSDKPHS